MAADTRKRRMTTAELCTELRRQLRLELRSAGILELPARPHLPPPHDLEAERMLLGGVLRQHIEVSDTDLSSDCLLYTSPSPRDVEESRMPSSA